MPQPADSTPMKIIALRLTQDQIDRLRRQAKRNERTVSQEIRRAIRRNLEEDEAQAA